MMSHGLLRVKRYHGSTGCGLSVIALANRAVPGGIGTTRALAVCQVGEGGTTPSTGALSSPLIYPGFSV